ncbi:thiamine phosphate synthase [Nitrospira sp. NS4]|uniref:thiamine phosphate synthase n=1 Tax=Nitrospira sp. NS4 TaxID=3414498 RepID=UPI003C2F84E9
MPPIDFRLILVTDRSQVSDQSLPVAVQQAVQAGLPAVQLRERDLPTRDLLELARRIHDITKLQGVPLLINDRVDLVLALDLDGVHLRANSLPVSVARRILGERCFVGVSTHSPDEVRRANDDGADYVIVGPVFDTPSKRAYGEPLGLERFAEACCGSSIPVFAIGGITRERISEVRRAGAYGVAMIGGILGRRDIGMATEEMCVALQSPL